METTIILQGLRLRDPMIGTPDVRNVFQLPSTRQPFLQLVGTVCGIFSLGANCWDFLCGGLPGQVLFLIHGHGRALGFRLPLSDSPKYPRGQKQSQPALARLKRKQSARSAASQGTAVHCKEKF